MPRDEKSFHLWREQFASVGIDAREGERLFPLGRDDNFWGPVGQTGPCGPDTEMFYDTGKPLCGPSCRPGCGCSKYVEIWNDVFMDYHRTASGTFEPLRRPCVDTGLGVERTLSVLNGHESVYDISEMRPIVDRLTSRSDGSHGDELRSLRIVADHIRSALFIAADGVEPGNVERGYVLRRLVRRATIHSRQLGIGSDSWRDVMSHLRDVYGEVYPELVGRFSQSVVIIRREVEQFERTLKKGLKHFDKLVRKSSDTESGDRIDGEGVFALQTTHGFPIEMTRELARERGLVIDEEGFSRCMEQHRKLSRQRQGGRFAGGLADDSEKARRYHTATHLLHAALRQVLGSHAEQRGSNITAQRLRFDFSHSCGLTGDELRRVEKLVNAAIARDYPVRWVEMGLDEAQHSGTIGLFVGKYGERVKVYAVGEITGRPIADPGAVTFSKEICSGPHAERTGVLGHFRIVKEQSAGRGIRRIRAVLE